MSSCRTVLGSRSCVVVIYNKEGGQVDTACQVGSRKTHAQTTSRVQAVCVVLNQSPILNCGEADQIFSYAQALSNLSSNRNSLRLWSTKTIFKPVTHVMSIKFSSCESHSKRHCKVNGSVSSKCICSCWTCVIEQALLLSSTVKAE